VRPVSGFSASAGALAVGLLNHLLDGQPWLRERLVPFSGRTVNVEIAPVSLILAVGPDGGLAILDTDAPPDAVAHLSPLTLVRLASGDDGARGRVEVSGDSAFAAVLAGVLRELRWDAEEDLSHLVGDIAARRVAQAGTSFIAWQRQAALDLAESVAEFWTEEQPLLARKADAESWAAAVDEVRDDTERLEKRIERLTRALPSR